MTLPLKTINKLSHNDIKTLDDYKLDSLLLVSTQKELNHIDVLLTEMDFFNQPTELGSFYPTENAITSLIKNNYGIIYCKRDYYEGNKSEERNIFVFYSPWKLFDK
ncbi:hypothetical protein MM221_09740 [Salipaludibacillus sp. LMS25]|uniref:hypothetical protein n=1 Tax=Salipaludibacillus sp. LMS25 TaxID=2924031 RepID=UPI0020D0A107|nr:hypothetical protein [Salipaludibacillus sp. LMS25]UTR16764.1 hypothetical protein MM221_09740 [Salipaludibacillus sp. LMS25]